MRAFALVVASGLALGVPLLTRPACAFCRTTTCDPTLDADGCVPVFDCPTRGQPLFWPDACVTYAVQLDGSALRGISANELDRVMQRAFGAWLGAACPGGGNPSLGVIPLGGARCDKVEFNPPRNGRAGAPNANIVMFRDEGWPYPDERFVIARTSITFDPETGAIYDADIEINSFNNEFSIDGEQVTTDLQAVLTHEVGHFLGLDHSPVEDATMQANYDLFDLGARTLGDDDVAGVCSLYAPLDLPDSSCPADTRPRHGFSRECGTDARADASCLSVAGAPAHGGAWLGVALGTLAWARRRGRWAC
ncbi:MAG TPA: matrixin family metalloprotease [Polyangiaceae bacterium]|nr:matrixin family metalloprotease [Polyangiaceae bacterium]